MTEDNYIKATNLAKLRIVERILRDLYFTDRNEQKKVFVTLGHVNEWIKVLEGDLKIEEETSGNPAP